MPTIPESASGTCVHCGKFIYRARKVWRHDATDLAQCGKSNGDQAEPVVDQFETHPLITEIERALRVLGIASRVEATNQLNCVPLSLTAREREAVLRRFDVQPHDLPLTDDEEIGEGVRFHHLGGYGLSGPGGTTL